VSIHDHCSKYKVSPHRKRNSLNHTYGWQGNEMKGFIWLWVVSNVVGRVGKMIINYQIPLKTKR
jgi:hypothetical protein